MTTPLTDAYLDAANLARFLGDDARADALMSAAMRTLERSDRDALVSAETLPAPKDGAL